MLVVALAIGLAMAIPLAAQDAHAVWINKLLAASQTAQTAPAKATNLWEELQKTHPLYCDWMQQDYQPEAWLWLVRPEIDVVQSMVERVEKELSPSAKSAVAEKDLRRLLARYLDACEVRRKARLQALGAKPFQMVFTKHCNMGGSHYAYTEGQSDAQAERHFDPGSALCLFTRDQGVDRVEVLLEDKTGIIRDPDVSYDGQRILFAWKKSDRQDDYHLYEMEVSTRRVRQLTSGLGMADYEGVYLPDGDILFNSTRCVQTVDCFWTEVSNLYRCDKDGKRIRRITFDQVHDNYPTVTEDGRILYTRWEYNDRSQIYPQPLLQMMPDGTGQTEFYGGNSWFPTTILHARSIPGTQKVVAIATGHHSRQTGKLIVIDPAKGRLENQGVQLIAPVRETKAEKVDAYGQHGELLQYPYPLNENEFLVAYDPLGWRKERGIPFWPRFGVYYLRDDGRRELLVADPNLPCNQPLPLQARFRPMQRPSLVVWQRKDGTFYVQDVYAGPSMAGVPRGTVKKLRVVNLEFRAAGIGANNNGGPGGGALISTPVAIGNGTWDPKVILGDADVYPDGSVFFTAPAQKPVYFQLLDEKGRMVQSMRSWATLQPGENGSCAGCHENKNSTAPTLNRPTRAIQAGPQALKPFYGAPRGFSFTTEIQPILNAKCVSCHDGKKTLVHDLTSKEVPDPAAKRKWTQAYLSLTHATSGKKKTEIPAAWRGNPDDPMVKWISAASVPTALPAYFAGANRSKLIQLLEQGHQKVVLTKPELEKISAWIDLGVPFCGDYVEANTWTEAEKEKYQHFLDKRKRIEEQAKSAPQTVMK